MERWTDEKIAEKALSLLCEDDLLRRLVDPSAIPAFSTLLRNVERTSWSASVKEQCSRVRELMDITECALSAVCL